MRFAEMSFAKAVFIAGCLMGFFFGIRILVRLFHLSARTDPVGIFTRKKLKGSLVLDFSGWFAAVIITQIAARYG